MRDWLTIERRRDKNEAQQRDRFHQVLSGTKIEKQILASWNAPAKEAASAWNDINRDTRAQRKGTRQRSGMTKEEANRYLAGVGEGLEDELHQQAHRRKGCAANKKRTQQTPRVIRQEAGAKEDIRARTAHTRCERSCKAERD